MIWTYDNDMNITPKLPFPILFSFTFPYIQHRSLTIFAVLFLSQSPDLSNMLFFLCIQPNLLLIVLTPSLLQLVSTTFLDLLPGELVKLIRIWWLVVVTVRQAGKGGSWRGHDVFVFIRTSWFLFHQSHQSNLSNLSNQSNHHRDNQHHRNNQVIYFSGWTTFLCHLRLGFIQFPLYLSVVLFIISIITTIIIHTTYITFSPHLHHTMTHLLQHHTPHTRIPPHYLLLLLSCRTQRIAPNPPLQRLLTLLPGFRELGVNTSKLSLQGLKVLLERVLELGSGFLLGGEGSERRLRML